MTGSEQSCDCSSRKAFKASGGRAPPFQPLSFLVKAVRGAVIWAKLRTCVRKKLQSPKNCLISCTLQGGCACSTALSLSLPGLTPSSVSLNPK